jgi:hypothetical protein
MAPAASSRVLLRLVLRPDRASLAAALGLAAALLLPVVGTLILAGLAPTLDGAWMAYTTDGDPLRWEEAGAQPTWVVAVSDANPTRMAYVAGNPIVEPGSSLAMPEAIVPEGTPRAGVTFDGLAPDALLVHPEDLGRSHAVVAGFPTRTDVPDAQAVPSRGSDAFEAATTRALRSQSSLLIAASVPAVALLASAFARQEIRARARAAATLSALGGARVAFLVLAGRMTLVVAAGAVLAILGGYALHLWGGPLFDPPNDPEVRLAIAIALPAAVAFLTGLAWAAAASRRFDGLKVAGPGGEDDVDVRVPAQARPILLGLRPLGLLLLAGLLFMADVGFPLAAAKVPASLAGGDDEWVFGAEDGLHVGNGVPATVATVAGLDPRIGSVLAETVNPTLLEGRPTVVRGGSWDQLADYHRLGAVDGSPPDVGQIVLGDRLARRLDADRGDYVTVQGSDRPDVLRLRVSGTVEAPGLLADEGFVAEPTGRRLADLPAGQASLLRVRPQTEKALAALQQTAPNLVVESLAIDPDTPAAGSLAFANVTVANLGAAPGQRALTVRVAEEAVGRIDAVVPGHARRSFRAAFIVPAGDWQVSVNPTTDGSGGASSLRWSVPASATVGQAFQATLLRDEKPAPDVAVALFHDLEAAARGNAIARSTTDADGHVFFTAPDAGDWVVGTTEGPAAYDRVPVVAASAQGIVVEAVWTDPAAPRMNHANTLFGQARNVGPQRNATVLGAYAGLTRFAERAVELDPGETTVVSFTLYLIEPVPSVGVGNLTLTLGTQAPTAPPPPTSDLGGAPAPADPALPTGDAVTGEVVQAQVADRALGDARAVLVGLAGSAVATTLAVVSLVTQRSLAGRKHVIGLLVVLGFDADRIRQRAAAEGAILGGLAALAALVPAKLGFLAFGAFGPPVFAHGLPDPVGWLFALQAVAAFAGVCALAAYFGAARATQD